MTTAQLEMISQLQNHLAYVQTRIAFHGKAREMLIAEAASVQADIDAIKDMREDELGLCFSGNGANEGQD